MPKHHSSPTDPQILIRAQDPPTNIIEPDPLHHSGPTDPLILIKTQDPPTLLSDPDPILLELEAHCSQIPPEGSSISNMSDIDTPSHSDDTHNFLETSTK